MPFQRLPSQCAPGHHLPTTGPSPRPLLKMSFLTCKQMPGPHFPTSCGWGKRPHVFNPSAAEHLRRSMHPRDRQFSVWGETHPGDLLHHAADAVTSTLRCSTDSQSPRRRSGSSIGHSGSLLSLPPHLFMWGLPSTGLWLFLLHLLVPLSNFTCSQACHPLPNLSLFTYPSDSQLPS